MTGLYIFIALSIVLWWFLWQQAKDVELHAHVHGGHGDAHAEAATPDDFSKIEGIGPAISKLMVEGGIVTFADMAKASEEELQKILDAGGSRFQMADPGSWPQQAKLAAAGDWDALQKLQDELVGGK